MTNRQALVLALFVLAVPNADAFVLAHARVHGRVARAHRPQTQRLWSVQRLNLTPDDSQANEIQISVEIAERAEGVRRAGGNTMERVDVAASASPIWEQVQWWKLLNENYAGWLLLNLVTVLWGSQHAIIKLALDDASSDTSPAQLNLARFFIAAGIFLAASLPGSRGYAEHQASTAASASADIATAREREIDSAHHEASGNAATAANKEITVPGVGAETSEIARLYNSVYLLCQYKSTILTCVRQMLVAKRLERVSEGRGRCGCGCRVWNWGCTCLRGTQCRR